jgi:hypothetical protein
MVPPWAVDLPRLFHLLDDIAQALPFVVPCALVVDIAAPPRHGGGPWTGRRQPQQPKTGGTGPPRLDGFGFMEAGVLSHDSETRAPWRWGGGVQQGQEVPKHSMVWARPKALQPLAGGKMPCPCARGLLVLPWCQALSWRPWRQPRRPDGGAAGPLAFLRPDPHRMRWSVFMRQPPARAPLAPVRGLSLRSPCGPLPSPAPLGEPAAHGFRGHRAPVCGLERCGKGGPTPPGAAPALWTRGSVEDGTQGAHAPRDADGQPHGQRALAVWGATSPEAPSARGPHDPVHTGTRAKQQGRTLRRGAACSTP